MNLLKWGKWSGHTLLVSPEAHFVSPHIKIQPPKFCLGQRSQCSTACFVENPLQKGCVQKAVCRAVRRLTSCLLVHPSFPLGVRRWFIGVSHGGELTSWFSPDTQSEQNRHNTGETTEAFRQQWLHDCRVCCSRTLETGIFVCCDTAVTIATGPLQPYGTDRTGPTVNPQVCAVV